LRAGADGEPQQAHFAPDGPPIDGMQRYALEVTPGFCGSLYYYVRLYPWHELLAHRFEMGLMRWS
jgi:hypothetical protein